MATLTDSEVTTFIIPNDEKLPLRIWAFLVERRDNHKCQCDSHNEQDDNLSVVSHHIIPIIEGGKSTLTNGICVCSRCHRLIHIAASRRKRLSLFGLQAVLKCSKCGHEWFPRRKKPMYCPKCMSPYWDGSRPSTKMKRGETLSNWASRVLSGGGDSRDEQPESSTAPVH